MESIRLFFDFINPLDLFFILVILVFALRGMVRGFIETLFSALALAGGLVAGWLLYRPLALELEKVGILKGTHLAAFLIIFIIVYLICKLAEHWLKKLTENRSLDNLDKAAGFLAGGFQGLFAVVLFIVITVNVIDSFFNLSSFFQGSFLFAFVEKMFYSLFEEGGAVSV